MKIFSLALFAVGILAPVVDRAVQRSPSPIAYISLQRISTEATEAKAAARKLETLRQAKTQDVNAKKQALDATRLKIANSGGVFSGSKRAELAKEESREQEELQRATQQAQTELQELGRQLQADLRRKLTDILADIANRRAVQIVLNSDSAVVWTKDSPDLTAEVLERLNAAAQTPAAK